MSRTIRKLIATAAAGAAAITLGTLPAEAAARTEPSVSFFPGGNGHGHWSQDTSNSDDRHSMALEVPDATSYAGIYLHHVEGRPAPVEPPSFDFTSTNSGPSGGSPRLHINFSDGGSADLRPLLWVQDEWITVGGADNNWDNSGGNCPFLYQTTYEQIRTCHAGSTVTSAYVVSDSGWLYPGGYTNYIDNLQYDGKTISRPGDNGRRN